MTRPTAVLAGQRILVGPNEIAGFTSRIAGALAGGGADVLFFNSQDHLFNPEVHDTPRLKRLLGRAVGTASRWRIRGGFPALLGAMLAGCLKLLAFAKTCFWAQTVVMVGGKGFFGGGLEYAFFRLLGKRVVHVFIGTASRPRYLSGYAKDVVKAGRVNPSALKRLARRTRRQATRIRGISRQASIVIENPLCGHFHERPFVNFFKLGTPLHVARLEQHPRLTGATPAPTPGRLRVLHCPSRPEIKGSARIQAVMEKLIGEGLPIEFRQITGVPHAQVLHEITQCDFVVDELYSDSPLAGFAAESSAFGKAAVVGGYGWKLFPGFLRPEEMPPTATCHPDDLESTVRALVLDPARRMELGAKARAFLEAQWSEVAFAARFARIVTGDIPADWWMKPEDVRYLHGLGLEEGEVRMIIGALVENFGASALQVDHVPGLKTELEKFGRGSAVTR
ncbi:MAG TPA: hypothetical protein VI136_00770 [Verrucomicrobiae bacterium]